MKATNKIFAFALSALLATTAFMGCELSLGDTSNRSEEVGLTVTEITVSASKKKFKAGSDFAFSGTITAIYNDDEDNPVTLSESDVTIDSSAFDSSEDNVGNTQTIKVSYTSGGKTVSDSYEVTIVSASGVTSSYSDYGTVISGSWTATKSEVSEDDKTGTLSIDDAMTNGFTVSFYISTFSSDQICPLETMDYTVQIRGYYATIWTFIFNGGTATSGTGAGNWEAIKDDSGFLLTQVYEKDGSINWYKNGELLYGFPSSVGNVVLFNTRVRACASDGFYILPVTDGVEVTMKDLLYTTALTADEVAEMYKAWEAEQ